MKDMKQPSETRQKINRVQQAKLLLHTTESLDDVYGLLNQLSSDVLDLYPHIACRTQCNTCCKGPSKPAVSPAEWEKVHDYLLRFYSEEQRQALIERTAAMYNVHKDLYWDVHDTIQRPPDLEKLEEFLKILPQLGETQCPMLVNETCSVYMSRPAKCRAHGAFLFVLGPHVQLHACDSEVKKMEDYLEKQGSRAVTMPFWNDFEAKIIQDYNEPTAVSTILTLWLLTHIHKGQLIEDVNLAPNFDAFRNLDIVIPWRQSV